MTYSDLKDSEALHPAGKRNRILFVAQHLPVPVRGGSSQRSHLLIEAMQSFADVELLAIGPAGVRRLLEENGYTVAAVIPGEPENRLTLVTRLLGFLFPGRFRYPPRPDALATLRQLWDSGRYDLVVGRYCRPSARAGVHTIDRAIIDIDDLESQKLSSWIAGHSPPRWLTPPGRWLVGRVQKAERSVIRGLSGAWFSAAEDRAGLPAAKVDVVPNIPFYPAADNGPSPAAGPVLFVASFDYRVNAHALRRLVQSVWPRVRQQRPDLTLRIIGGGLDAAAQALLAQAQGVEYAGFVEDLTAEYVRSLCSIVPIWEGGGSKIKVLESLAQGRSCVVAAPSMRGYDHVLSHGQHLLVATDEDAMIASILDLASDGAQRHRLEDAGREAVNRHFSRAMLAAHVRASIERVLGAER